MPKVSVPGTAGLSVPGPVYEVVEVVEGQQVYGRQAVRYDLKERWELRPAPDDPNDIPVLDNRGRYDRPDGGGYQIDAVGKAGAGT